MLVLISGSTTASAAICDNYFILGRDHDYQTLNLTFTANLLKFCLIIGMFPKPLKQCVLSSISALPCR